MQPRYSIDTSSLIAAWRERYPVRHFAPFWGKLETLLLDVIVVVSKEVFNEVERKDEELFDWLKQRSESVIEIDDAIQPHVSLIMTNYPKLADTRTGKFGADPWVIALSMTSSPKLTVITEEGKDGTAKRPKIPFVCEQTEIQVPCTNLLGLIQAEDWIF